MRSMPSDKKQQSLRKKNNFVIRLVFISIILSIINSMNGHWKSSRIMHGLVSKSQETV